MIEKPIFVVGAGRSGSSLFHQMFTEHPHVAWMSTLCDRHPEHLGRHRALMYGIDLPLIGRLFRRRWESAECYDFWNYFYRGFAQPCRDLRADDATPRVKAILRRALEGLVTPRRSRPLVKITGWPRLGFLHAVFPDAHFIHVYRDGRAVANSLLQVDFWRGWQGPAQWRWGTLDAELQQEWESHGRSFVALAGIQWKILMRAVESARKLIPAGKFMDVRYEDFAKNPIETLRQVAGFCDLGWAGGFEQALSRYEVESANYKWQKDLDPAQQRVLLAVLGEELRKYGYD
jgi:Sulfotransferase family